MRESDDKSGFTQVDNVTLDLILPTLSPAAQLVFLRIFRQTVGWWDKQAGAPKTSDKISLSQFRKYTGYKENKTIIEAIGELKKRKLVKVKGTGTKIREYSVDFSNYPTT